MRLPAVVLAFVVVPCVATGPEAKAPAGSHDPLPRSLQALTRVEYDNFVTKWKQENPHIGSMASDDMIEELWQRLIGDPHDFPVLVSSQQFTDLGVISSDVYTGEYNHRWGSDGEWYLNTANFFRQVRNFVIDTRATTTPEVKGIHWQVAQATSLQNIHFVMRQGSDQIGLFIENGSGGLLGDLVFDGGESGMLCGSQQFTSKNLWFRNSKNAIRMLWDWGWVWKGLYISDVEVGINFTTGDFPGGSITVVDSSFERVKTGILLDQRPQKSKKQASLTLLNVQYTDVGTMVSATASRSVLEGGSRYLDSWFVGNLFVESDARKSDSDVESGLNDQKDSFGDGVWDEKLRPKVPQGLLNAQNPGNGYFDRSRPQYEDRSDFFVPNAKGDGKTDDTAALNLAFALAARIQIAIFLPAGSYIVTDTVFVPSGSVIVGMCWSQIVASGTKFQDMENPRPMIQVGIKGQTGGVELSDLLFTAQGPTAGLVGMEWNLRAGSQGTAAMWDSHFRIGGAAGTGLQAGDCPRLSGSTKPQCIAGSLLLHLTNTSSAYLENVWAWTADHDLDDPPSLSEAQLDIYVARGILIESTRPTWLWATASEHNVLYQYQLNRAENVFMGLIQTVAPNPFSKSVAKRTFPSDPAFDTCKDNNSCRAAWALHISGSKDIHVVGAGLYSWFYDHYGQDCIEKMACQKSLVWVDRPSSGIHLYNLFTVGAEQMITMENDRFILAKDNQMLIQKSPWTSVIAGWVKATPFPNILRGSLIDMGEDLDKIIGDCYGLDLCHSSDDELPIADYARSLTRYGGYLCALDKLYANCHNESHLQAIGGPWDFCFYARFSANAHTCSDIHNLVTCPAVESCNNYRDPSIYWVLQVMEYQAGFARAMSDMAFFDKANMTHEINFIAGNLTKLDDDVLGLKKTLKIISQVFSFIGVGFAATPGGKTAERSAEVVEIMGLVFDSAQEYISEEEDKAEREKEYKATMLEAMDWFLDAHKTQMEKYAMDFYYYGNLTSWNRVWFPSSSEYGRPGARTKLKSDVAQYLSDQRFITLPTGEEFNAYSEFLYTNIRIGLVLVALTGRSGPHYILKDSLREADCKNKARSPTSEWIDGHCYTLHVLGEGNQGYTVTNPNLYSRPADSRVANLFKNGELLRLYRGSIHCQAATGAYYGEDATDSSRPLNITIRPDGYDPVNGCFFNMAVFQVRPQTAPMVDPTYPTPCYVLQKSFEREAHGGDKIVGVNYLPDDLAVNVTSKFCSEFCVGHGCVEENKPNGCPPGGCGNGTTRTTEKRGFLWR